MLIEQNTSNDEEAKIIVDYVDEATRGIIKAINPIINKFNSDDRLHTGHFLDIMMNTISRLITKHINSSIEVYTNLKKPLSEQEAKDRCAEGLANMLTIAFYKSDKCHDQEDLDEMCEMIAGHLACGESHITTVED